MLRIIKNRLVNINKSMHGDTIVEVLIAMAIASFAIGSSYTLANKSLQNAITSSDRNKAVSIAENQIADLKIRHQTYNSEKTFNDDFGVPSTVPSAPPYPVHGREFCLIDGVNSSTDPNWAPKNNTAISNDSSAEILANYNAACVQNGQYYVNITAMITSVSTNSSNNTIFRVSVHWPTVGSGTTSSAVLYYRLNSGTYTPPVPPTPQIIIDTQVYMNRNLASPTNLSITIPGLGPQGATFSLPFRPCSSIAMPTPPPFGNNTIINLDNSGNEHCGLSRITINVAPGQIDTIRNIFFNFGASSAVVGGQQELNAVVLSQINVVGASRGRTVTFQSYNGSRRPFDPNPGEILSNSNHYLLMDNQPQAIASFQIN